MRATEHQRTILNVEWVVREVHVARDFAFVLRHVGGHVAAVTRWEDLVEVRKRKSAPI
jgi:hypothetical protein